MPFDGTYRDEKLRNLIIGDLAVLYAARHGCSETGWIKGELASGRARCAIGWVSEASSSCDGPNHHVITIVERYLAPALPPDAPIPRFRDGATRVAGFNDAPSTTQADVVALFDRAIARVEVMINAQGLPL